jgi:hypothetical protein
MQERLTEKSKLGGYQPKCHNGVYQQYIDKLGKIEDLMEKYQIKDIEMLEKMIVRHDKYCNLEEEIGCPLDVYVKLHQQMKFYRLNALNEIIECEIDNPNEDEVYHIQADGIIFNQYDYGWQFYSFKDYKKTWWLKETKEE